MRYKDIPKVAFVYVPCKTLPGLQAIPISEIANVEAETSRIKEDLSTEKK